MNLSSKGDCGQEILSIRSLQGLNQLTKLELLGVCEFNVFEGIRHLTALEELGIRYGEWFSLPPSLMHHLPSIKSLTVSGMYKLQLLEKERLVIEGDKSSRYQPPPPFATLKTIMISCCDLLRALPDWLGNLSFLQSLTVTYCPELIEFPESFVHLTSFRKLVLQNLYSLQKLPKGLEQLPNFQNLFIDHCPKLSKQFRIQYCNDHSVFFKRNEEGYWYKISGIPNIVILPIKKLREGGTDNEESEIEDLAG